MPDGNWGTCTEVPAPPGCEPIIAFINNWDKDCCIARGYCCQDYPQQNSVGNCPGVNLCG